MPFNKVEPVDSFSSLLVVCCVDFLEAIVLIYVLATYIIL